MHARFADVVGSIILFTDVIVDPDETVAGVVVILARIIIFGAVAIVVGRVVVVAFVVALCDVVVGAVVVFDGFVAECVVAVLVVLAVAAADVSVVAEIQNLFFCSLCPHSQSCDLTIILAFIS